MSGVLWDITSQKRAHEERAILESQLLHAQKMESVGRLAGGVAHDFNNMLSVVIGHADIALAALTEDHPIHEDLREIRDAAERAASITRQLLGFARRQTIAPRVVDLNQVVTGVLKVLSRLIGEDIALNWSPSGDLWPVKIDPTQLEQLLANLCVNARDAIRGVGRIEVETRNAVLDEAYCATHAGFTPGDFVQIVVSDTGCGIDKDTLPHIFDPFFTTKPLGQGTGLGLATVYGIVKQNGGFVSVYSESGQGTRFTIYLPRVPEGPVLSARPHLQTPERGGSETILLVEDEVAILKLTTRMLRQLGYTVIAAGNPEEAMQYAAERPAGTIDLLLTDVVMPQMNGRDLAHGISASHPGIACLFTSGYTANVIAHRGVLDEGVMFLEKPFSLDRLARKLRQVLDREPEGESR